MIVPPLLAAIRLPLTLVVDFLLILVADALMFKLASDWFPGSFHVDNFGSALLMALVTSAVALVLEIVLGANDDDEYSLRVVNRIAKRSGERVETRRPGDHLPRDRRPRAARAAAGDARRQRAEHGPLARARTRTA